MYRNINLIPYIVLVVCVLGFSSGHPSNKYTVPAQGYVIGGQGPDIECYRTLQFSKPANQEKPHLRSELRADPGYVIARVEFYNNNQIRDPGATVQLTRGGLMDSYIAVRFDPGQNNHAIDFTTKLCFKKT